MNYLEELAELGRLADPAGPPAMLVVNDLAEPLQRVRVTWRRSDGEVASVVDDTIKGALKLAREELQA